MKCLLEDRNFYYFDPEVLEGKGKTKSRTVQNKVLKAILKPEIPKWVDNRKKVIFQKEVDGLDYWESKI